MTDTEKRIAIAEACGWKMLQEEDGEIGLIPPDPPMRFVASDFDPNTTIKTFSHLLPHYLNCLNAMHEAEKCLFNQGPTLAANYCANLMELRKSHFSIRHQIELPALCATARKRADAFLKTIGKL